MKTSPGCLRVALLVSLCVCRAACASVGEDMAKTSCVSGADCSLPCAARPKPGVQYRSVRWYKVGEPPAPRLSGLVTRDLPNGTVRWYSGVERQVDLLDESRDMLFPNATCGDSGVYTCHLAAPVGEQNQEGRVLLTMTDCPVGPAEHLTTDAYMVFVATAVLMLALVIFRISYVSLKNTLRDRNKTTKKEILLDAPLKPLEKKDLMLIYTLGPKSPKEQHICV
uniref:CD83 antigen n=1 Tax=Scatophagus argus TaxID=75038 RepID=UPI001ED8526D|nr:CD83 antigen [Scatophagus argus]